MNEKRIIHELENLVTIQTRANGILQLQTPFVGPDV
jgi:hypothetical protein